MCGDSIICIHARAQYTIALVVQIYAYVHLISCPSKMYIDRKEKTEDIKERQDKNLVQYITKNDFHLFDHLDWLTLNEREEKKSSRERYNLILLIEIFLFYVHNHNQIKYNCQMTKSPNINAYDNDNSKWTLIRCKLAFTFPSISPFLIHSIWW
jgi:hypothetical protein